MELSKIQTHLSCLGLLALLATCAVSPSTAHDESRPNIVFVLVDDLGIGDLRCYNPDSKIATVHLDRLAAGSVRCTDAHSPSSVCSPTRYGVLTGRYAWRSRLKTGVLWGLDRLLIEPGRQTLATMLAAAGYHTACFGKWHLGLGAFDPDNPRNRADFAAGLLDGGPHTVGFDESLVIPASLDIPPYVYVENGVPEAAPTARTEGSKRRWSGGGGFWRAGAMQPGFEFDQVVPRFAQRAVRFIEERSAVPDKPWFLYLPLPTPHTPWVPTAEFHGQSGAGYYGDFVAQLDAYMGELMAALGRTGQADNTLVIFTSDNGSHWRPQDVQQYEHDAHLGLRGMKADIHEAGHRVPLLVHWPQGLDPRQCDGLIGLQDWYATLAEIVGHRIGPGEAEDSQSLLALLRGRSSGRDELVHHSLDGMFALRSGSMKWIDGLGSGGFTGPKRVEPEAGKPTGQLYDLAADRSEQRDQASHRQQLADRMHKRLQEVRASNRTTGFDR